MTAFAILAERPVRAWVRSGSVKRSVVPRSLFLLSDGLAVALKTACRTAFAIGLTEVTIRQAMLLLHLKGRKDERKR
ncbi:MAG: hypothetical protein CMH88_16070 [Oceanibulbus sp.]|nr:hypothetical protein [Sulfitobacter sp.]